MALPRWLGRLLCRIGSHEWRLVYFTINWDYLACERCGLRVAEPNNPEIPGVVAADRQWLTGGEFTRRPKYLRPRE
jgi:hypothetical protein